MSWSFVDVATIVIVAILSVVFTVIVKKERYGKDE